MKPRYFVGRFDPSNLKAWILGETLFCFFYQCALFHTEDVMFIPVTTIFCFFVVQTRPSTLPNSVDHQGNQTHSSKIRFSLRQTISVILFSICDFIQFKSFWLTMTRI